MVDEPASLSSLVEMVNGRSRGGPLDRVDAARRLSGELTQASDDLLGYFVDEARRDGESWTAIGQRLGVSKQAARQRFGEPLGPSADGELRLMPRLRVCIDAAASAAALDGSSEIGTHHHLIGLCREGVAGATLAKLGLREDAVRAAARDLFPPAPSRDGVPPDSLEATVAVERAARLAGRARCRSIGTEHLLYAIAFDPGSRARHVLNRLDTDLAALKSELSCALGVPRPRRLRRRSAASAPSCSFCGKGPLDHVRLVTGARSRICDECVLLCTEMLAGGTNAVS